MGQTKIEWCDRVWNPVTGCSPISEGCQNCYARRMAYRLKGRHGYPKDDPFCVTFHPKRLNEPLRWRKPSRIFVCSMGDLFHKDISDSVINEIWGYIYRANQHTFLILTKRPLRLIEWTIQKQKQSGFDVWPPWVWLGVSVENQRTADQRIPILLQIPAAKRFISCEPLLGEIDLWPRVASPKINDQWLHHIDWCIVGGETGPRARPIHPDWVRSLREQCQSSGVPFFFKSLGDNPADVYSDGAVQKKGRLLDGREWNEYPE